jgi:hypothetical protein
MDKAVVSLSAAKPEAPVLLERPSPLEKPIN